MFVNLEKLQTTLLNMRKSNYTGTKVTVGSEKIQVVYSVDVFGFTIKDDKISFNF